MLEPSTLHFPCLCTCEHITLLKTVLINPGGAGPRMAGLRGATPDSIERPFNNLLRRLRAGDFALIAPSLVHEEAGASQVLYNPGAHVEVLHFPCGPSLAAYPVSNANRRR